MGVACHIADIQLQHNQDHIHSFQNS
jgi:hypothetical protein